jgi:cytoskeletal protein CcmA (bactofilin family)
MSSHKQLRRFRVGIKNSKNLSIIDKELKIEGSISSSGKLIIKGQVTGTIEGDVVIIAEDGQVNSSSTKVSSITIGGKFKGEVTASKELIILSTGTCEGKVECKDLIVENGGVLNAEVTCKTTSKLSTDKDSRPFEPHVIRDKKQIEL